MGLVNHRFMPMLTLRFYCNTWRCGWSTLIKQEYEDHMEWKCPVKYKNKAAKRRTKREIGKFDPDDPFSCGKCGKSFKVEYTFKREGFYDELEDNF